ncbi:MAG: DUF6580 family putative transport protein [Patescibacteria group bacterium]|jgi:hypothetical protein
MKKNWQIFVVLAIIILAAASRLVHHPFNFTPIIALALFAGCYSKKHWAIILPLGAMLVSDYFIGFYDWQVMASVYVGFAIAFYIGWFLKKHKTWYGVGAAALISSVVFFGVTNFAVWGFFEWYPHTWAGLVSCFTLALPFFRNSLAGDLIYSAALFGLFETAIYFVDKKNWIKQNTTSPEKV